MGSASALPGGDKYYEAALKHYTADYVTAENAHQLGLKEVQRITTDMKQVIIIMLLLVLLATKYIWSCDMSME